MSPSRLAATEDDDLPSGSQLAGAASGGSATAAEAAAKARGKLVSALMKRHLVEQVGQDSAQSESMPARHWCLGP